MPRIIGRGRYVSETYPQGPGGGAGGGSANVPLTRQRFIDGGTSQSGLNGSAAQPFKTITQFIASRTNSSVDDATANYVGWLTPALNGYTENIAFPAYASTEIRADSISLLNGTNVTGNVTWANVGGANAAQAALVSMHNVNVTGSFTVTDDAGAPLSTVIFGGDELGNLSCSLGGGFVANTTAHLATIAFENAIVVGGIDALAAGAAGASSATVIGVYSTIQGTISARAFTADGCSIDSATITIHSSGEALFFNSEFSAGSNPVLDAPGGAKFDGASWRSFLEAGGTRAAGTAVLVVGGYNAGPVEGAALPTGAGPTNVSLNGSSATAGYTGENSGNHYKSAGLLADSIVVLKKDGALEGDTMLITKTDTAAQVLTVQNSSGGVAAIPSGQMGFVLAQFSTAAGDWLLAECGAI